MTSKDAKPGGPPLAKPKRRLNAAQKRALRTAALAIYLKEVGRPAPKHGEPNDRRDSFDLNEKIRKISATEFDRLMREDEDIIEP